MSSVEPELPNPASHVFQEAIRQLEIDPQKLFVDTTRSLLLRLAGFQTGEINRETDGFLRRATLETEKRTLNVRLQYDKGYTGSPLTAAIHEAEVRSSSVNTYTHVLALSAFHGGFGSKDFKYIQKARSFSLDGGNVHLSDAQSIANIPVKKRGEYEYDSFPTDNVAIFFSLLPQTNRKVNAKINGVTKNVLPLLNEFRPKDFDN